MKHVCCRSLLPALVLFALAGVAHAEIWFRLEPIEDAANPTLTYVNGLNNKGEVVGFVETNGVRAFLWRDGTYTDLVSRIDGTSLQTEATGINDRSRIVGHRNDRTPRAFLLRNDRRIDIQADSGFLTLYAINNFGLMLGKSGPRALLLQRLDDGLILVDYLADLPGTGESGSTAWAFNEAGVAVGASGPQDAPRPVLWTDGSVIPLPLLPNATRGEAKAINNLGQVVGNNEIGSTRRAFLWSAQVLQEMARLGRGDNVSEAYDINDWGVAVGYTANGTNFYAVMWVGNRAIELTTRIAADDPLKASVTLQQAYFINDRGQIVASGADASSGSARMFLLTPVYRPVPTSGD
jgi:probable HAF family extracellular repeat protein